MTWTIERRDDASRVARTLIGEALAPVAPSATVADAVLLTSELVTNVMMHTEDDCTLALNFDPAASIVRVEVTDSSPDRPAIVAHEPTVDRIGGFGLKLVARLAAEWGYEVRPHRKTVWFELDGYARLTSRERTQVAGGRSRSDVQRPVHDARRDVAQPQGMASRRTNAADRRRHRRRCSNVPTRCPWPARYGFCW